MLDILDLCDTVPTEQAGWITDASDLCSRSRQFESQDYDWGLSWFSLVPTGKWQYSSLNYAMTSSFHIVSY
jgi:hypothetical protein